MRRIALTCLVICSGLLVACGGDGGGGEMTGLDGGSTPVDGSSTPTDSGSTATDAGDTPTDAGDTPTDAGDAGGDSGVECPTGMAGPTCEDCAAGYQDDDGDGSCELGCDATGADALDCGDGGSCEVDETSGLRGCVCDAGYEEVGGTCVLDLPPESELSLWLDADAADSLTLSDVYVRQWADRRPGVTTVLTQSVPSARPGYVASGRSGRAVVRFDGGDQLFSHSFSGLSGADYEIIVAAHPIAGATPSAILSAVSGTTDWAVMLDQHQGTDYRLIHRDTPGPSGGDAVVANRSDPIRPGWIAASLLTSGTLHTIAIWASDDATDATDISGASADGIGSPLTLRLGRSSLGFMTGDIYEVLIYTRRLSVSEREEVTDYLSAKWNLH